MHGESFFFLLLLHIRFKEQFRECNGQLKESPYLRRRYCSQDSSR